MKQHRIFPLFLLLTLSFCVSGCLKKTDKSEVLARFDGQVITENDFQKKIESFPNEIRSFAQRRKKEFLEDMVAESYLLKEAQRQKIEKLPDVEELIDTAKKRIVMAKLIEKEVDNKIKIGPADIQNYYDTHKEEFMTPPLFRASHILVKTEEDAQAIRSALVSGADFEETARQKSIDATAIRGGDLGFFQKGQFVPEFEEAAFQLKKGEISQPVKTQFGYHLIKLTDRAEPTLRDFRLVRRQVEERLVSEQRTKVFKALVQKLKGNAKIEYSEKAVETPEPPAKTEE